MSFGENIRRKMQRWEDKAAREKGDYFVRLQGVGKQPAKRADELVVGDTLVWNYGSTSTVVTIEPVGKASLRLILQTGDGRTWERLKRRETLVGVTEASP